MLILKSICFKLWMIELLNYFIKSRIFINPKNNLSIIKRPNKYIINTNFIKTMKHINSYWVENIYDMDPKLSTEMSSKSTSDEIKKNVRIEDNFFLLPKCVISNPS